ncbi:MAG: DoxX family membrane protein [Candidatus Thorarchaeota archaeon]
MAREIIKEMHKQKISGGYLVLLRITLGLSFITTWFSNLTKGVFTTSGVDYGFEGTIRYFIDNPEHISTPVDTLFIDYIFPNWIIFALGWMIVELLISLTLTFGVFTRAGSIIGAGSTIILGLGSLGVDWPWTYALLFIGCITCALVGAGRWYGFDYWLKDKIPDNIANFLL